MRFIKEPINITVMFDMKVFMTEQENQNAKAFGKTIINGQGSFWIGA